MSLSFSALMALLLDWLSPREERYGILQWYESLADQVESRLNQGEDRKRIGIIAWLLLVLIPVYLSYCIVAIIEQHTLLKVLLSIAVLYVALVWQGLLLPARRIAQALILGDLDLARSELARIRHHDKQETDSLAIARITTEAVLKNAADSLFAVLFWFFILGIPGVVLYRLAYILDLKWGYRNEHFRHFGWMAARSDDVLNYIPARLSALVYALNARYRGQQAVGKTTATRQAAMDCWKTQAPYCKSPNSGAVLAAGAGAIGVSLGGDIIVEGKLQPRPLLGPDPAEGGTQASASSIDDACELVNRSLIVWTIAIVVLDLIF